MCFAHKFIFSLLIWMPGLLIAKLHHGHLSHADGNGDWVLTIFSALSLVSSNFLNISTFRCYDILLYYYFLIMDTWFPASASFPLFCALFQMLDVLEFVPSHVVVCLFVPSDIFHFYFVMEAKYFHKIVLFCQRFHGMQWIGVIFCILLIHLTLRTLLYISLISTSLFSCFRWFLTMMVSYCSFY